MHIISVPEHRKLKCLHESKTVNEGFFDDIDDIGGDIDAVQDLSDTYTQVAKEKYSEQIKKEMDRLNVVNYHCDYSVYPIAIDVRGPIDLSNRKMSSLPDFFYFRTIFGDCTISNNRFTSMKQWPREILGDLVGTSNFISAFDSKISVKGDVYMERQFVRTDYKLTDANWRKYMNDTLMENRCYIPETNEYGNLESIDELGETCKISLDNGQVKTFLTEDVDYINGLTYIETLMNQL